MKTSNPTNQEVIFLTPGSGIPFMANYSQFNAILRGNCTTVVFDKGESSERMNERLTNLTEMSSKGNRVEK